MCSTQREPKYQENYNLRLVLVIQMPASLLPKDPSHQFGPMRMPLQRPVQLTCRLPNPNQCSISTLRIMYYIYLHEGWGELERLTTLNFKLVRDGIYIDFSLYPKVFLVN